MSLWEYKLLSSKQTPFANLSLLESFLNVLGKDQWEIISWRTSPDNPLEFEALAKRLAYKEWYLEGPLPQPPPASAAAPARKKDDSLREIVLPEAAASEEDDSIWDDDDEGEMPENIFEAVRPFLKRNPQSNILAASVELLAEKFGVEERDLINAFSEEGLKEIPPGSQRGETFEHGGFLYWFNRNQRGQVWINAKQKPKEQPQLQRQEESPSTDSEASETAPDPDSSNTDSQTSSSEGTSDAPNRTILDRIRPMMRRNKRGHGFSGSIDFLARALKTDPAELISQIEALGVRMPATAEERIEAVPIGRHEWYFNRASNGQIWINGRDHRPDRQMKPSQAPAAEATSAEEVATAGHSAPAEVAPEDDSTPTAVAPEQAPESAGEPVAGDSTAPVDRSDPSDQSSEPEPEAAPSSAAPEDLAWLLSLKEHLSKAGRGSVLSAELASVADAIREPRLNTVERLARCGLQIPDTPGTDGSAVSHEGQIWWVSMSPSEELVLNVKDKPRRTAKPRSASKKKADTSETSETE
jgi:hypothetical protein